jgi:hypothetical protein
MSNPVQRNPPGAPVYFWMYVGLLLAAGWINVAAAQMAERVSLPPGQVWQCVRDGHKTFSDAPCGAGATIRHLNDLNIMEAAPASRAPAYPPPVVAYDYHIDSARDAPPPLAEAEDAVDPVYGSQVVGIANPLQRARRRMRPLHHDHPSARTHAGHAAAR